MIKTVTVYTGESEYAKAAQQYAIEIAGKFNAQLRVVGIWDSDKQSGGAEGRVSLQDLVRENQEDIAGAAERAGVRAVNGLRGDGITRGLLEEARETDLIVLGLPSEGGIDNDAAAYCVVKAELPVIRKAECSLIAVSKPPSGMSKIMARYEEGRTGKAALRMAAFIAERYGACLGVLTLEHDTAKATELAVASETYLEGFEIHSVETMPRSGPTDSKERILDAAKDFGADLTVMGEEGNNWLERVFGQNLAERTALSTSMPLLIAR